MRSVNCTPRLPSTLSAERGSTSATVSQTFTRSPCTATGAGAEAFLDCVPAPLHCISSSPGPARRKAGHPVCPSADPKPQHSFFTSLPFGLARRSAKSEHAALVRQCPACGSVPMIPGLARRGASLAQSPRPVCGSGANQSPSDSLRTLEDCTRFDICLSCRRIAQWSAVGNSTPKIRRHGVDAQSSSFAAAGSKGTFSLACVR